MNFTLEHTWKCIEEIVPNARAIGYVMPEALKAAAVELLLMGDDAPLGSYTVIVSAIRELKSRGWLEFSRE